ncbi:uncharacterized protein LOC109877216 [Oncorhynchus kisutch]|uniref:uncharacterized protein LOC109877216 n=1 Tax=Oncorhynchus kisutch TaxID=8019 RepID=UPI0012DDA1AB|nr:uncharacterized protein LOC109877216 [Oncorhynchus kisutch]XP_031675579.1 uncharacterized protein LOC109877216 [Oncorhynchus kisutch]
MSSSRQVPPTKRKTTATCLKRRKINEESLKSSGTAFIGQVIKFWKSSLWVDRIEDYVEKLLHSIFFLGHIHEDRLLPNAFFESQAVKDELQTRFKMAFHNYMSPPCQTPFSILLTLAVKICGHEDEDKIQENLLSFLEALQLPPKIKGESNYTNYYTLEATVIALCYNETPGALRPVKYYGASLSCRGERAKKIMINQSCLNVWHDYVSYAVLSFRHDDQGNGISFPGTNCYEDRRPCKNCGDLFSLPNPETDKNDFPYGNCAETECLSNLIFNDEDVQSKMIKRIDYIGENLKGLREKAKKALEQSMATVPES